MVETMLKDQKPGIKTEKQVSDNSSHYEFAKKTIDSWPSWKKEIGENLIRLATQKEPGERFQCS